MPMSETLALLAARTAHRHHDALAVVDRADGERATWGELAREWRHGALGLDAAGLDLGEPFALDGHGGRFTSVVDRAVMAAGGAVLAGDSAGARRITRTERDGGELAWDALVEAGRIVDAEQPDRFEKLVDRLTEDDVAVAGSAPGDDLRLSHGDLVWAARSFARLVARQSDEPELDATVAAVLDDPIVARVVTLDWPSAAGSAVWWPDTEDPRALARTVLAARPTVLVVGGPGLRALAGVAGSGIAPRALRRGRAAVTGDPLGPVERASRSFTRRRTAREARAASGLDRCRMVIEVAPHDAVARRELAAGGIATVVATSAPGAGGLVTVGDRPVPGAAVREGIGGGLEVRPPGRRTWVPTPIGGRARPGDTVEVPSG